MPRGRHPRAGQGGGLGKAGALVASEGPLWRPRANMGALASTTRAPPGGGIRAILGPFCGQFWTSERVFGLPVKFRTGTHQSQKCWSLVEVFRDFRPVLDGIRPFGARIRILREKLRSDVGVPPGATHPFTLPWGGGVGGRAGPPKGLPGGQPPSWANPEPEPLRPFFSWFKSYPYVKDPGPDRRTTQFARVCAEHGWRISPASVPRCIHVAATPLAA